MRFPSIHLNGTPKERLLGDINTARVKIREAIEALQQTAPHGRDYYIQGSDAASEAHKEYLQRLRKLEEVRSELDMISWAIQEGGYKK